MKWLRVPFLSLVALLACSHAETSVAGNPPSVDVRGVTFYYLDGSYNPATPQIPSQGFRWVLDNQYDPAVRARIDNLLAKYRAAGVRWIRLLVAANHFPASEVDPVPSSALIQKLNDFLAITRTGPNAGKFHVEIVLIPRTQGSMFAEPFPYTADKLWFKTWLDHINFSNVGMIMFGGDLSPCLLSGCEGQSTAQALPKNHGKWIREIWSWKDANYPTLNASYEVIGVQQGGVNNPALIAQLAQWSAANTPSNPIMAASLYVNLAPGSTWQQYATAMKAILDSYASVSSKPLWIDEFGKSRGTDTGVTWTLQDQRNAYLGVLGATFCQSDVAFATFAWVAGRDYPYHIDGAGAARYNGLVESWSGSTPVMSATWQDLSLYYKLTACP